MYALWHDLYTGNRCKLIGAIAAALEFIGRIDTPFFQNVLSEVHCSIVHVTPWRYRKEIPPNCPKCVIFVVLGFLGAFSQALSQLKYLALRDLGDLCRQKSCVCASCELQLFCRQRSQCCQQVDCRGVSRAILEIFENLLEIHSKPRKTVKMSTLVRFPSFGVMEWHERRCCGMSRVTRPLRAKRWQKVVSMRPKNSNGANTSIAGVQVVQQYTYFRRFSDILM